METSKNLSGKEQGRTKMLEFEVKGADVHDIEDKALEIAHKYFGDVAVKVTIDAVHMVTITEDTYGSGLDEIVYFEAYCHAYAK